MVVKKSYCLYVLMLSLFCINYAGEPNSSVVTAQANVLSMEVQAPSFADSLVMNTTIPLALSTLASTMKTPYILLAVSEGVAFAYLLFGEGVDVSDSAVQSYLSSFQTDRITTAALTAIVSTVAKTSSTSLMASSSSSFVKPLILTGSLVGAATSFFASGLSDHQKSLAYAGLVSAATPVVADICSSLLKKRHPVKAKTIVQKIKDAQAAKARIRYFAKAEDHITTFAVALISLTSFMTTIEAFQEGTLSPQTQLLAGLTLAQAVSMAREKVMYEYSSRVTKKGLEFGSNIISHTIVEPIREYGKRIIGGVFQAFGWNTDSVPA